MRENALRDGAERAPIPCNSSITVAFFHRMDYLYHWHGRHKTRFAVSRASHPIRCGAGRCPGVGLLS